MKAFVAHDQQGVIRAVFVPAQDADEQVTLEPAADETVTEVDAHGEPGDPATWAAPERYRIVDGGLVER